MCDLWSLAEQDSGNAGGRNHSCCSHYAWVYDPRSEVVAYGRGGGRRKFWRFSQTGELKVIQSGERYPILVSKYEVSSQMRYFRNVLRGKRHYIKLLYT